MEFTFKIENYYPYESRVFVIYTPTDAAFEPLGGWAYITPDMTPEQIKASVIDAAPLDKWASIKSAAALGLVGSEDVGVFVPPVVIQPPPETIEEARARKLREVKVERDKRKSGGVLVNGKWFHSDTDSRVQQIGLVMMGAAIPAVQWKTMDGSFITMSQALAGGIFQAVATLDMTLFARAEAHTAAIQISADPAGYDISSGWPEAFA